MVRLDNPNPPNFLKCPYEVDTETYIPADLVENILNGDTIFSTESGLSENMFLAEFEESASCFPSYPVSEPSSQESKESFLQDDLFSLFPFGAEDLASFESTLFSKDTPEPVTVGDIPLSFSLDWIHKKGKKKPQQFWVYCEKKQQSHAKISLSPELGWNLSSRMFRTKENLFCLVRNFSAKSNNQEIVTIYYDNISSQTTGKRTLYPTKDLTPVQSSKLSMSLQLEPDTEFPVHPSQNICPQMIHLPENSQSRVPFQYVTKFCFSERKQGWFKLRITLSCAGDVLISNCSNIFMFNDPRLKNRKKLEHLPSRTIKQIQILAITQSDDGWPDENDDILLNPINFALAREVFGKKRLPSKSSHPSKFLKIV